MHLSPHTLSELSQLIRQWSGLSIGREKAYLIRHRLAPVVRSCGFAGFDELLLRLQASGATRLQDAVIEAITTKETSFFRDLWLFDALLQHVLPALAANSRGRIRIWSAATSTGQEAYSLAMLVRERLDSTRGQFDEKRFEIVASDISAEAIDAARTGVYSAQEIKRGLSEDRARRYLQRHGEGWQVVESLRRLVQFRTFNLLRPATELGAFDLVLCRNVLIYFDDATRKQVCRSIETALREGGWLAVGSAESLHGTGQCLVSEKVGRAYLYRKDSSEV